ncbi:MAG: nucleic acid binding OB-fold tRNA/helicase-type, partial [Acidimicrobiia bacterium]|nr:nucleic acid binding OB-fold tRNA/helicase-type [Acidimicrobiia bacterium]
TVISQIADLTYGSGLVGRVGYFSLQAGTMLILVLAANTSFADFPRLASFHAGDNFMPRQFMVRGHRLVFSNGIVFLAVAAIVTLLATGGEVSRLIPLYAIGVFTSFTLSQSGMAKHHIRLKEPGWRTGLVINGIGALLSAIVLGIVGYVKFPEGAWVIIVLVPIMVFGLVRLNRAYEMEDIELKEGVKAAAEARTLRRHELIVLVDKLDVATARALQYARTLSHDDLRAVHFDMDPWRTDQLTDAWSQLGFRRFPLDIIECPDRRIPRATLELAAGLAADGETEVTVLIPRRQYTKVWHRLLHDRSSDGIAEALADLPNCNVTIVPYHLGNGGHQVGQPVPVAAASHETALRAPSASPDANGEWANIGDIVPRHRGAATGRVRAVRVQPWGGAASLECTLADPTGSVTVVFLGRRSIPGLRNGTVLRVDGVAADHHGRRTMLNPEYTIVSVPTMPEPPGDHH